MSHVEVTRLSDRVVLVLPTASVDERVAQALSFRDRRGRAVVRSVTIAHADGARYEYREMTTR